MATHIQAEFTCAVEIWCHLKAAIAISPILASLGIAATGRGVHLYARSTTDSGPSIVLRDSSRATHHLPTDGGYVVAPHSLHQSERQHTWVRREIPTIDAGSVVSALEAAGISQQVSRTYQDGHMVCRPTGPSSSVLTLAREREEHL